MAVEGRGPRCRRCTSWYSARHRGGMAAKPPPARPLEPCPSTDKNLEPCPSVGTGHEITVHATFSRQVPIGPARTMPRAGKGIEPRTDSFVLRQSRYERGPNRTSPGIAVAVRLPTATPCVGIRWRHEEPDRRGRLPRHPTCATGQRPRHRETPGRARVARQAHPTGEAVAEFRLRTAWPTSRCRAGGSR